MGTGGDGKDICFLASMAKGEDIRFLASTAKGEDICFLSSMAKGREGCWSTGPTYLQQRSHRLMVGADMTAVAQQGS
eukprot:983011-Pelagomonas_calceolata.AAC.5